MTVEENNKTLGILHLVYGGLHALILLGVLLFFIPVGIGIGVQGKEGDAAAGAFMAGLGIIFGLFWLFFSLPSIITGYGLLKRKSWVKTWAMIAGGVAGMSFPLGTALCVYTFWFFFSGGGNQMYGGPGYQINQGQPRSLNSNTTYPNFAQQNRDYAYAPPKPGSWRGDSQP